jgi:hypothetical protein
VGIPALVVAVHKGGYRNAMFSKKIKIPDALWAELEQICQSIGCSIEEFATKAIEREVQKAQSSSGRSEATASEVEAIANKMKGLGYIE